MTTLRGEPMTAPLTEWREGRPLPTPAVLSPRQRTVLRRIAENKSTKEMAFEDGVSPKTIECLRMHIYKRSGLRGVAALTQWALKHRVAHWIVSLALPALVTGCVTSVPASRVTASPPLPVVETLTQQVAPVPALRRPLVLSWDYPGERTLTWFEVWHATRLNGTGTNVLSAFTWLGRTADTRWTVDPVLAQEYFITRATNAAGVSGWNVIRQ